MMQSLAIPLAGFLLLVLPTGGLCQDSEDFSLFPRPRKVFVLYSISADISTFTNDTVLLYVPRDSTFFDVMNAAVAKDCSRFRFTYEYSNLGPYITSVQGLMASDNQHTYWELMSNDVRLDKGAGNYKVTTWERLEIRYSKY
ncbi:transcobalamin-1-like [Alligator sinensis]|uniref:Transcobalamin-1-like n=1 Tax=Alligator sinensis TaxID=38654 RepID=A0A3Q0GSB8_ALLSI|nr:transcobalamin-1-like [Alligator sinensis]